MPSIQSEVNEASQKATALKSAAAKLAHSNSITEDTQTTVVGNQNAHQALQAEQKTALQIAQAVNQATENLKSVAQDFEALDQSLATSVLGGLE